MKTNKKSYMVVTENDFKVLMSLFRNKVANLVQIQRVFFPNTNIKNVARFMRRLKGSDYVHVDKYMIDKKRQNVYSITHKGLDLISSILESKIDSNNYKSQAILHDLKIFDISECFEKFKQVQKIYYESELQSSFNYLDNENLSPFVDLRSDLVLKVEFASGDGFLPLEYERTLKEYSRNVKKFEEYYSSDAVVGVLYLCENDSIIKNLMKVDEYVCQSEESKMYFCNINQVKNESDQITFKGVNGHTLVFKMAK